MIEEKRRALHELLDAIPSERLDDAKSALGSLADPVLLAFYAAPEDDEPLTADDIQAINSGKAGVARGDWCHSKRSSSFSGAHSAVASGFVAAGATRSHEH